MPSLPQNVFELLIVLLLVLPGTVYQFVRTRLRGPNPDDDKALNRILRALAVSALLIAAYASIAGPQLAGLLARVQSEDVQEARGAVRAAAAWALVLLVVVPTLLAVAQHAWRQWTVKPRTLLSTYDPLPRAWDGAFLNREPCYVRVLTVNGRYLGGWFGYQSVVSSYPEPREMFLERAFHVGEDGEIGAEVAGTQGMYVRCDDVQLVEFLAPQDEEGDAVSRQPQEEDHGNGA